MMNISLFLVVALLFPLADLWLYPRLQRATAAGTPGVRVRYHLIGAASLWLVAAGSVAVMLRQQQPWSDLRLDVPSPLRLAAGFAVVIAYIAYVMTRYSRLIGKPDRLRAMMKNHANIEALLPHTPAEAKTFAFLSISAGVCEEIVYRGFVLWFTTVWLGVWTGFLATSVIFGLAHAYLGRTHILRTAIAGLVLGIVAVGSASLLPAILLHAFTDLLSGDLGYRALRLEPLEQVRHERLGETIGNGADGAALLVE